MQLELVEMLVLGSLAAIVLFVVWVMSLLFRGHSEGRVKALGRRARSSFDYRRGDHSVVMERRERSGWRPADFQDDDFGELAAGGNFSSPDIDSNSIDGD